MVVLVGLVGFVLGLLELLDMVMPTWEASVDKAAISTPTEEELFNQGEEYYVRGEFESAIASFDQAIALDPQYDIAYANRGYAYYNLGDDDKAIADYELALIWQFEYRSGVVLTANRSIVFRKD